MSEEIIFIKKKDPIYGDLSYPTAYLRDAKIYFIHYSSEDEAYEAWERRKRRIILIISRDMRRKKRSESSR